MVSKARILAMAKGFRGRAKNCHRPARQRVEKGLQYAYRDRRDKKREARSLWIQQINAASRQHGLTYSQFIRGMVVENVKIDRKVLAELAMTEPYSFKALAQLPSLKDIPSIAAESRAKRDARFYEKQGLAGILEPVLPDEGIYSRPLHR